MRTHIRIPLMMLVAFALAMGASSAYPAQDQQTAAQTATATPVPSATPRPIPATSADALAIPRGTAPKRLVAVMIDNHPNAYPQYGLDKAVIVFEGLAEYGISRYMAIFAPGISPEASQIGPVRSARPYFVEWAKGLDAVYVHAGGSREALTSAQTAIEILNMDGLHSTASSYFWRGKDRVAPHNFYTKSSEIDRFVTDKKGTAFDVSEHGFLYADSEAPNANRPASQSLNYYLLYKSEMVGWNYDAATNTYLRLRGKNPYLDGRTKQQLQFKNVIAMEVKEIALPANASERFDQNVIGQGSARIFLNGTSVNATWRKGAGFASLRFYDANDTEILLNYGSTWIVALPSLNNLTVK